MTINHVFVSVVDSDYVNVHEESLDCEYFTDHVFISVIYVTKGGGEQPKWVFGSSGQMTSLLKQNEESLDSEMVEFEREMLQTVNY